MPALFPHLCLTRRPILKEQMQPQLHDPVRYRRPCNASEVRVERIRNRLRELRAVQYIEEVSAKLKPPVIVGRADRNREVLLQREIEIVHAGIANVREI